MSSSLSVRKGVSQVRNPVQAAQELYTALYQPNALQPEHYAYIKG